MVQCVYSLSGLNCDLAGPREHRQMLKCWITDSVFGCSSLLLPISSLFMINSSAFLLSYAPSNAIAISFPRRKIFHREKLQFVCPTFQYGFLFCYYLGYLNSDARNSFASNEIFKVTSWNYFPLFLLPDSTLRDILSINETA